MNKISRRVSKLITFDLNMLDQIEVYMEVNGLNFTESVRRIISAYFANSNVSVVSINDSEPDDIVDDVVKEILEDMPKVAEQPPNGNKNDFNWDDIKV